MASIDEVIASIRANANAVTEVQGQIEGSKAMTEETLGQLQALNVEGMESSPLIRDLVRAIALGDDAKMKELNNQLPDADCDDYVVRIAAMFTGVTGHVFEHDQSLTAVGKMEYAYRNAKPPFKPLAMETLFRALLGEEHLLDEVSAADQFDLEILAIHMIVDQFPTVQAQLESYLSDAEILATQWQSAE